MKLSNLIIGLLLITACGNSNHPKPVEIYTSGKVDNWDFFTKIDKDDDTLVDVFMYKYDTSFVVRKNYGETRNSTRGYAFYYNGKKEGKWLMKDYSGKLVGELNFKNDKQDGYYIVYGDENKILFKELYRNGEALYRINYLENGDFGDSISYVND